MGIPSWSDIARGSVINCSLSFSMGLPVVFDHFIFFLKQVSQIFLSFSSYESLFAFLSEKVHKRHLCVFEQ